MLEIRYISQHSRAPITSQVAMKREELGNLFDLIRDAMVVADAATGRIVQWNAAAETIFGYSAEEAIELSVDDLVPDELKSRLRQGLIRYIDAEYGTGANSRSLVELPALRKDGTEF